MLLEQCSSLEKRQVLNNMIEGVSVQLLVGYKGRTALHHV
jgi:hypothetical protein